MGEKRRQSPRRTRHLDAPERRVLGQVQRLRAEGEQRRVALGKIQTPRVHLHETPDQRRRRLPLTPREPRRFGQQFFVGEIGKRGHERL